VAKGVAKCELVCVYVCMYECTYECMYENIRLVAGAGRLRVQRNKKDGGVSWCE
jgi:hypothetical protein